MDMQKARWTTDGDNFSLSMPMTKIDEEKRLVSGWASLDNPDLQGDIVTAEASEKAFSRFRGNIREMHQPIAVGRMVSYRPDQYYDPETKKFYNGIFVTARISKGAQATWEKVLDGTLQAFSIKGPILDSERDFSKSDGTPLRIVKDYDLEELSLVDSGGNQLANLVSIEKVNGVTTGTGIMTEMNSENVFYCSKHVGGVAKTSTEESAVCPEGHAMERIGWFEYDGDEKAEKMQSIIAEHTANVSKQAIPATNEGGVDVAEGNEKETPKEAVTSSTAVEVDTVVESGQAASEADGSNENLGEEAPGVADNAEVTEDADKADEELEKAADVSEVEVEEPANFEKLFSDFQAAITGGLEKSREASEAALAKVTETFEKKFGELAEKHDSLATKFDSLKTELDSVEKRVDGVESDTAVKKSGDLGGSAEETLVKRKGSGWGGIFLSTTDL